MFPFQPIHTNLSPEELSSVMSSIPRMPQGTEIGIMTLMVVVMIYLVCTKKRGHEHAKMCVMGAHFSFHLCLGGPIRVINLGVRVISLILSTGSEHLDLHC